MEAKKQWQLPRSLAERWVNALRSGKWEQGTGFWEQNTTPDGPCCTLGLLGKIERSRQIAQGNEKVKYSDAKAVEREVLNCVMKAQGFESAEPFRSKIMHNNDTLGKTFPQMADWIEANVEFTNE